MTLRRYQEAYDKFKRADSIAELDTDDPMMKQVIANDRRVKNGR